MRRIFSIVIAMGLICSSAFGFAEEQGKPGGPAASIAEPQKADPAATPVLQPDPSGANTGGAVDVVGATAGAPTAEDMKKLAPKEPLAAKLADVVGHNRIAINIV